MPVRAKWRRVWLGRFDDPEENGWLPVDGDVSTSDLAVFERKVTLGDATKDSDDYVSSWILSDFTGGQGINTINEGTDVQRFWWSNCDTRFNNQLSLAPLVTATAPAGVTDPNCIPLGDVPGAAGFRQTFYAAFGATPYGYNDAAKTWYPAAPPLDDAPTRPGVLFNGTAGLTQLFIPLNGTGYAAMWESAPGTSVVTNVAATSTTPGAVLLATHDTRLWAMDSAGVLWKSPDGAVWDKVLRPEADSTNTNLPLQFDLAETPEKLVSYMNRAGDPALCCVTERAVWIFDEFASRWVKTNIQSNHPDFGFDAEVWRAGEDLWVAQGTDILRLTSAFVVVPFSGPARDDSVPREYRSRIVAMAGEPGNLWVATEASPSTGTTPSFLDEAGFFADDPIYLPTDETYSSLMAWQGTGWHPMWVSPDANFIPTRLFPSILAFSGHKLWMGGNDGFMRFLTLKYDFMPPKQAREIGIDEFADSGWLETGWFDASMLAFEKVSSHVIVDCEYATDTETVTVSYKTQSDTDWIVLGQANTPGLTSLPFTNVIDVDGTTFSKGLRFYRLKLRLDLRRGSNSRATPIISTVNLMFTKNPQNTTSFQFAMPLPKRRWNSRTAGELRDHVRGLITAGEYLKFVHQDQVYRVKVAGFVGTDDMGEDRSGVRNISLITIPTGINV